MVINNYVFRSKFALNLNPELHSCPSLLVVLTGGLFLILLTWRSDIKLNCTYRQVPLRDAKKVLLKDKFEQIFEEDVVSSPRGSGRPPHFVNKKIKYVWDPESGGYAKLRNIDEGMTQGQFHRMRQGLGQMTVADRLQDYGENLIKISVPPVLYLVFHEALNPFYLFQAYTVILWSVQLYWKFAVIIALSSVVSVTACVWETRRQSRNLRNTMKTESSVLVLRNGSGESEKQAGRGMGEGSENNFLVLPLVHSQGTWSFFFFFFPFFNCNRHPFFFYPYVPPLSVNIISPLSSTPFFSLLGHTLPPGSLGKKGATGKQSKEKRRCSSSITFSHLSLGLFTLDDAPTMMPTGYLRAGQINAARADEHGVFI